MTTNNAPSENRRADAACRRWRRWIPAPALVLAASAPFVACATEPPEPPAYRARPVAVVERFAVEKDGAVLGHVVHLEIRDPAEPVRFYRIVDESGRWLGHATAIGRFSRRVPFQEDEEDLGVWSLAHGTARLFGVDRVALRALPAEAAAPGR
jgi:hypothetical protein